MTVLSLAACNAAKLALVPASLKPRGAIAQPDLFFGQTLTLEEWEDTLRSQIWSELQSSVYGIMPDDSTISFTEKRVSDAEAFGTEVHLEEIVFDATASYNGVQKRTRPLQINIIYPKKASGPVPVIMMQTFCPNYNTFPHPFVSPPPGSHFSCNGDGIVNGMFGYVFGRYITTPPIETILERGYAIMTMHPPLAIPDRSQGGLSALRELSEGHDDDNSRWGTIGAWAWLWSRAIDVIENDPRIDQDGLIAYGHSRYGKSALVAGAYDPRIDVVIAHQSGTGGASLSRDKPGETVEDITAAYPHWFTKKYAEVANDPSQLPIDQHHLLALIAPRPLLLGNARRDIWSDPNGGFRAAQAANKAYNLYGSNGLEQSRLNEFNPQDDVAVWIRPGTHGVVKEDWPAFLQFLDAHLKK